MIKINKKNIIFLILVFSSLINLNLIMGVCDFGEVVDECPGCGAWYAPCPTTYGVPTSIDGCFFDCSGDGLCCTGPEECGYDCQICDKEVCGLSFHFECASDYSDKYNEETGGWDSVSFSSDCCDINKNQICSWQGIGENTFNVTQDCVEKEKKCCGEVGVTCEEDENCYSSDNEGGASDDCCTIEGGGAYDSDGNGFTDACCDSDKKYVVPVGELVEVDGVKICNNTGEQECVKCTSTTQEQDCGKDQVCCEGECMDPSGSVCCGLSGSGGVDCRTKESRGTYPVEGGGACYSAGANIIVTSKCQTEGCYDSPPGTTVDGEWYAYTAGPSDKYNAMWGTLAVDVFKQAKQTADKLKARGSVDYGAGSTSKSLNEKIANCWKSGDNVHCSIGGVVEDMDVSFYGGLFYETVIKEETTTTETWKKKAVNEGRGSGGGRAGNTPEWEKIVTTSTSVSSVETMHPYVGVGPDYELSRDWTVSPFLATDFQRIFGGVAVTGNAGGGKIKIHFIALPDGNYNAMFTIKFEF
jgi:hypothetical protein